MREIEVEQLKPETLLPFAKNPKKHPPEQIQRLVRSIEEFGWTNPILAVRHEGKPLVIAGHARLEASEREEEKEDAAA